MAILYVVGISDVVRIVMGDLLGTSRVQILYQKRVGRQLAVWVRTWHQVDVSVRENDGLAVRMRYRQLLAIVPLVCHSVVAGDQRARLVPRYQTSHRQNPPIAHYP